MLLLFPADMCLSAADYWLSWIAKTNWRLFLDMRSSILIITTVQNECSRNRRCEKFRLADLQRFQLKCLKQATAKTTRWTQTAKERACLYKLGIRLPEQSVCSRPSSSYLM